MRNLIENPTKLIEEFNAELKGNVESSVNQLMEIFKTSNPEANPEVKKAMSPNTAITFW